MASLTFTADPTDPTELDAVMAAVQSLRARIHNQPAPAQAAPAHGAPAPAGDLADKLIVALKARIGRKLRAMLVAEAKLSKQGEYTMQDLAKATSQTAIQIRSHRGNLGRSLVRAKRDVPGAPEIWIWNGDHVRMPEDVRKAVLKHLQ